MKHYLFREVLVDFFCLENVHKSLNVLLAVPYEALVPVAAKCLDGAGDDHLFAGNLFGPRQKIQPLKQV